MVGYIGIIILGAAILDEVFNHWSPKDQLVYYFTV